MKSPCTDICKLDEGRGWCLGCGRTLDEIAEWGSASAERRRAILAQLPERLADRSGLASNEQQR